MKICAISFHSCPFSLLGGDGTGGMSVYLRELCSVTSGFPGIKLDIFTRIQNPEIRGIKYFSSQARVIHLKGGPKSPVDRTKVYDFLPEFVENLESFLLKESEKYDLLYTHYWLSGLVGDWMKRKYGLPLVHTYHTLAFMKKRILKDDVGEHRNRLQSEVHLGHVSDDIISSSKNEMSNLITEFSIPASKIKVISPGVNEELFYPIESQSVIRELDCREGEKILLFVGRIDPVKGLMSVVKAFELLKQRSQRLYNNLKLVVIGGGEGSDELNQNKEYSRIKEYIREKKLGKKILFLGSKKQTHLKKYYSAAEALVMPSLYESFGLVALEALACGTPVIASRISEMRSIVQNGKNGFFFKPNDPFILAQKLKQFFSSKQLIWGKERIRKDVLDRFSWKRMAQETYSLFETVKKKRVPLTTRFQPDESPQLV